MLLPKQVISFEQLQKEGLSKQQITAMYASLRLFPTPFKGIYYVPLEEERRGRFIENPLRIISQATMLFLRSSAFYFSCETAEESLGLNWRPSGSTHIVNDKLSRRINLREKIKRNGAKRTWRAQKLARILSFYGNEIVFHKTSGIERARTKRTPYGRFALKSQIKLDRKRFKEKP